MSTIMPSKRAHARELATRRVRKVLAEHVREDRRCCCGWTVPAIVSGGDVAFRDHLADRIVEKIT